MAKTKKLTLKEKLALGIQKPAGKSKYALKQAAKTKGNYTPNNPFKTEENENSGTEN